MIIDATDLIAGRLASFAAKQALLGEKVDIVNSEKAVISGDKENVLAKYQRKKQMGTPAKGPFLPKMPHMFLRRIIRGMLPYKQEKGKKAFEKIRCYIGVPDDFKGKELKTIEKANVSKLPNTKYINILNICRKIGANI